MSDQTSPDLETRLQGWLAARAPAEVPVDFAERIAAIPSSVPGARPVPHVRPFRSERGTRPMLLVAAMVALTLGLVAGGVFIASSRHDAKLPLASTSPTVVPSVSPTPTPKPAPTTAAAPTSVPDSDVLPAVIPDTVDHGSVDTPLGSARWVHLQGDAASVGSPFQPMPMPDGTIAWFSPGGPGSACFNQPTTPACTNPPAPSLSVSEDALAAREPRTLPVEAAQANLQVIGETAWLVTSDPVTFWRSSDLTDWIREDISGLHSPGPSTLEWTMSLSVQAEAGDSTIASVSYTANDPGSLLGHPGENARLAATGTGTYGAKRNRSMAQGGDIDLGPITIEKTANGLRFLDADKKEVGRVDGVGQGFVDDWVRRGEIRYDRLAYSDGETWSMAELPVTQPVDWPLVVPLNGAVMVFATDPDTHVRAWRTTDGQNWSGGTPIVDPTGTPIKSGGMTYRGQGKSTVIVSYASDGITGWKSTDGEHWAAGADDMSAQPPVQFDHGFMRTSDQTPDGTWQVSRDGTTFEEVPALKDVVTKVAPDGAGGSTEFAIGDTVVFLVEEGDGQSTRDVWMIDFARP